jgi:8-oxo-dGTP pyrophosphatase MutT (NUDIX family)
VRRPEEVFVFVRRGDEYLVLHRAPGGGSYWHGVAGALEPGEDFSEAARRELEEETSLVAEPVAIGEPYAYAIDEEPRYRLLVPPGTTEIVVGTFLVEAPARWEPRLDHEHDGYRWCSRDDALSLLYWPEPREILASL